MQILNSVGWALAALAAMGVVYQGVLVFAIWRFFAPRGGAAPATPADWPAVSLLKPLHGDEPHLADNLLGFLAQDYAGAVQMVCGVNHPGDAAAAVARGLIAAHPDAHIALSTGPAPRCANGKVGNLVAMMPLARHDILILSDSDMVVTPDYLRVVTQALRQPGVGAVSCAFTGRGDAGFWSRLGAAMVSFQATPNVILAAHFGLERPCMGATIAIRRATLTAIGGFEQLADVLADDYAIGEKVAAMGQSVVIAPLLVEHAGFEGSVTELWRHFLRWAVTIRDLNPAGHYGAIITQPFALALLAGLILPGGWALALVALVARLMVAGAMRHSAGRPCAPLWLVPLGDIFGFCVFCVSLFARKIDWRGAGLTIAAKGRIADRSATPDQRDQ